MSAALALVPDAPAGSDASRVWDEALLVAALIAVDPAGLGGAVLRSGPSPARDAWLAVLRASLPQSAPFRRIPSTIDDDRLLGGLDLGATLGSGRASLQRGVLAEADGGMIVIAMAERLPLPAAARIATAMDTRMLRIERDGFAQSLPAAFGVVALDEGITADEAVPAALAERLAFSIDLSSARSGLGQADARAIAAARLQLSLAAAPPEELIMALAATAAAFGIGSLRSLVLAIRAMCVHAALCGRTEVLQQDAEAAARLVLAPRARCLPAPPEEGPPAPEPPPPDGQDNNQAEALSDCVEDVLRDAMQTALPPGLLEELKSGAAKRAPSGRNGAGAMMASKLRGRPVGVRAGKPAGGARLALVETLRAAAPWQGLRRAGAPTDRIAVRTEDLRIRRFAQRRESTVIFAVDASGSTAFQRLAEAKGAVEALLADAYVARTAVALIAFRGQTAEVLLPPSRSLTRAKTLLAALPGGGGTPLAAGLDTALGLALGEKAKGRDPLIVVLTDGRANVARDGTRPAAMADAKAAAMAIAAQRIPAVFLDTSQFPRDEAKSLAAAMAARFVALPRADAAKLVQAVRG